nr:MAG TPA_asm: Large Terminase [Caudoviricetes sp.]
MELSYGQGLAREFGLANMEKIEKHGGRIFDIELDKRLSAAATWKLKGSGGGMVSRSFGGDVTGRRADILIIDDPIKNRSQANSPAYRENIWKEWRSTVQTRLRPGASIILVLTRWHEDDLAGRIMEQDGRDWEVISLPAIAKENDLLGRQPGEALWSEYGYDEQYLEMIKKSVGPLDFASLYQQDPQPQEGTLIKRHYFQYYATAPRMESYERVILSWDLTFKDAETSDFVVGQAWGKIGPNFYLIDETRARMDILETIAAIKNMRARYKRASGIYIEDKANGPAVITLLKKQISGIVPVNPVGGKVERVQAMLPLFAAGNVFLPSPELYPDIDDFVHELAGFPFASNDDRVDAATQALKELSEGADIFIGR